MAVLWIRNEIFWIRIQLRILELRILPILFKHIWTILSVFHFIFHSRVLQYRYYLPATGIIFFLHLSALLFLLDPDQGKSSGSTTLQYGFQALHKCIGNSRVEWFSLFAIFENGHIAIDWLYFYEFNSKKYANFSKSQVTCIFFFLVGMNLPLTSKTNCQK